MNRSVAFFLAQFQHETFHVFFYGCKFVCVIIVDKKKETLINAARFPWCRHRLSAGNQPTLLFCVGKGFFFFILNTDTVGQSSAPRPASSPLNRKKWMKNNRNSKRDGVASSLVLCVHHPECETLLGTIEI